MIINMSGGKSKDENLIPENIKNGIEIDGVVGNFTGEITGYKDISGKYSVPSTLSLPENWKILFIHSSYGTGSSDNTKYMIVRSLSRYFEVGNTTSATIYTNSTSWTITSNANHTNTVFVIDNSYLSFVKSYGNYSSSNFYGCVLY